MAPIMWLAMLFTIIFHCPSEPPPPPPPPPIIESTASIQSNAIATLAVPSIMLEASEIMVSIASTQSIYTPWVSMSSHCKAPTYFQQTIMLQLKMLCSQVLRILQCVENKVHAPV